MQQLTVTVRGTMTIRVEGVRSKGSGSEMAILLIRVLEGFRAVCFWAAR